jgi:hypothetical protein
MTRRPRSIWFVLGFLLLMGWASRSHAATVTEAELNYTATDNTSATAQFIPASAFTLPVSPDVFNPPGFPTASVVGVSGIINDPSTPCVVSGTCVLGSDFDWYTFYANGGGIVVDADSQLNPLGFLHGVELALFDDGGIRIAAGTIYPDGFFDAIGTCPFDPNSGPSDGLIGKDLLCPFAGPFQLPKAGNYFLAVIPFDDRPTEVLFGATSFGLGPQPGEPLLYGPREPYVVQISLERPIPFPATLWLLVSGFLLTSVGRRLRLLQ